MAIGKDSKVLKKTVQYCKKQPLIISLNLVHLPGIKLVLPDFQCQAQHKGRGIGIEWARREFSQEYTLYLDEDSLCGFEKIPEADIVQFQEVPTIERITPKNLFIGAIEAHRMGFQIEQAIFEKIKPLYLWGGICC